MKKKPTRAIYTRKFLRELARELKRYNGEFMADNKITNLYTGFTFFKAMVDYDGSWSNFKKMIRYMAKKPKLNLTLVINNPEKKETIKAVI